MGYFAYRSLRTWWRLGLLVGLALWGAPAAGQAAASNSRQFFNRALLDVLSNARRNYLKFPADGTAAQFETLPSSIHIPFRPLGVGGAESTLSDSVGQLRWVKMYAGSNCQYDFALTDGAGRQIRDDYLIARGFEFELLPWPAKPDRALLIHTVTPYCGQPGPGPRLTVSVIVGAPGGAGYVPPDSVNVPFALFPPTALNESQVPLYTVLGHANGRDLWVVTVSAPEGFRAFRLTPAGLDLTHPVESRVGRAGRLDPLTGYPRPLGDGTLLVTADQRTLLLFSGRGGLERFAFEPATGRVTEQGVLQPPLRKPRCGGARFWASGQIGYPVTALSPGGRYVYQVRPRYGTTGLDSCWQLAAELWQHDARAVDSGAFRRSGRLIRVALRPPQPGPSDPAGWQQLFTGPDGRIYATRMVNERNVRQPTDRIDCPDQPGAACAYRDSALFSLQTVGTNTSLGYAYKTRFPVPYSYVRPQLVGPGGLGARTICPGQAVRLALAQPGAVDSVRWDPGDGSPPRAGFALTHTYPPTGGPWTAVATYHYGACGQDTLRVRVALAPPLPARLLAAPADSVVCADGGGTLRARADSVAGVRWQWAGPGTTAADTLATLAVRQAGIYRLTGRRGPCAATDSVRLEAADCALPNVVTPNGDGRNDGLVVDEPGAWTLDVYSRWGRRVWSSGPGTYRSGAWPAAAEPALAAGLYYYHLTRPADGRRLRGWVQLVR